MRTESLFGSSKMMSAELQGDVRQVSWTSVRRKDYFLFTNWDTPCCNWLRTVFIITIWDKFVSNWSNHYYKMLCNSFNNLTVLRWYLQSVFHILLYHLLGFFLLLIFLFLTCYIFLFLYFSYFCFVCIFVLFCLFYIYIYVCVCVCM